MKKTLLFLMSMWAMVAQAQVWGDIQVMYDYGHNFGTLTTEVGHNHKSGNGYGFVDFDFGDKANNGMYWEYGYNFNIKRTFMPMWNTTEEFSLIQASPTPTVFCWVAHTRRR